MAHAIPRRPDTPQPTFLCSRDVSNDFIGVPCPECQHTGMCHPGRHNPDIEYCVLCELILVIKEVNTWRSSI